MVNRKVGGHHMICKLNPDRSSERGVSSVASRWSRRKVFRGAPLALIVLLITLSSALPAGICDAFEPSGDEAMPSFASAPLLQTQDASTSATTPDTGPTILQELRNNLHLSGYTQNTTGVFYNTEGTKWWIHHHLNSLADERQQSQIDLNESFGEHLQFFARFWGVYEPSYPFENDARIGAANLSDFYNEYAFRDLWLKIKEGALTLFIGSQIVEWGESLAFRVGDQINPQDISWGFGFANLEQSHRPIYMVHPIYNLPALSVLSSNFLEMVYAPGFDFLYNHVDYPDDRFTGQNAVAGRVDALPVFGSSRFGGGLDNRCRPGESLCLPGGVALEPPYSYIIEGGQSINTQWAIPRATFANSQLGFRLHTLIDQTTEASVFYWRSFDYIQVPYVGPAGPPGTSRLLLQKYPHYESLGATMNRPLPMPMFLSNTLPLVMRAELFYKNHDAFSTSDRSVTSGVINSDTLNTLLALDLDSMYVPWLTTTGNLTANFEFQELTILDSSDRMLQNQDVLTKVHKHEVNLLANVGVSWYWNAIAPNMGAIYNPDGTTFLLLPGITLTPPWTDKYFMKIGSVYILGNDKYAFSAFGSLKGSSNIFAQFQYNFNLL